MNKIILLNFVVLLFVKCLISQQLPVISLFSCTSTTAEVTIDLNQEIMSGVPVFVQPSSQFITILEADSTSLTVLTSKQTRYFIGYGIGSYYFSNRTYVQEKLLDEENLTMFAYYDPIQYYDSSANLVSMSGSPITNTITITSYDLISNQVTIYNTSYYFDIYSIGCPGPLSGQISTFFVDLNTTEPSILVFDTTSTSDQETLYTVENYNEVIVNGSYSYPISIKGQLYLVSIESDPTSDPIKTVSLLQVSLDPSSLTANVKSLYQRENVLVGGLPCIITYDQQNLVFIDTTPSQNFTSINYSVFNLQSSQLIQIVTIENTLDVPFDEYTTYYAQ